MSKDYKKSERGSKQEAMPVRDVDVKKSIFPGLARGSLGTIISLLGGNQLQPLTVHSTLLQFYGSKESLVAARAFYAPQLFKSWKTVTNESYSSFSTPKMQWTANHPKLLRF